MEKYNIYDEIGRGTHSFVYKARRKRSIEYVAVKSTAKCRMDKVLNEVPFLHKLDSRYVLKFFDWYESSNHIWLILEYCMGGDLLNLITQDKQLPESAVKSFGSELMGGLQYLHASSILYCDLKPANILIDEFGSLKLADFGLARRIPTRDTSVTRPLAPGSPHYMAPELFQQPAIHSFASDFWALGCVLYELRTGRQPFTHSNFSKLARMIQTEVVVLPVPGCEMSSAFCDLLQCLLVKDPHQRITWDELIDHPFWDDTPRIAKVPMPAQELFDLPASSAAQNEGSTTTGSVVTAVANSDDDGGVVSDDNGNRDDIEGDGDDDESENNANSHSTSPAVQGLLEKRKPEARPETHEEVPVMSDPDEDTTATESPSNQFDRARRARNSKVRPVTAPVEVIHSVRDGNTPSSKTCSQVQNKPEPNSADNAQEQQQQRSSGAPHTAPPVSRRQRAPRQRLRFKGVFDRDGKPGGGLRKVSRLIFTATDCRVKSIICSEDVQLSRLPCVRSELLHFEVMTPEKLLSGETDVLERHLKEVYINLKAPNVEEMLSVMAYLFSLCRHSKLANVIVNSSILKLLIRMLAHEARVGSTRGMVTRNPILSMLCLVLGVLFRFATFIAPSSPDQLESLVTTLMAIVHQSDDASDEQDTGSIGNLEPRPLALACLGELLFYTSTQQEWELPMDGMGCVLSFVEDPDIGTRYYAVRTLANILIHCTGDLLPKLVTESLVLALLRGLLQYATAAFEEQAQSDSSGLSAALHTTTTEALAQLFRHLRTSSSIATLPWRLKRSVMLFFAKPNVLYAVWRGVVSTLESLQLAVASLNILNAFLEMKLSTEHKTEQAAIKASRTLLLERVVTMPVLMGFLKYRSSMNQDESRNASEREEATNLMRTKVLLLVHLGVQLNRSFLIAFVQTQGIDLVERVLVPFASQLRSSSSDNHPSSPDSQTQTALSAIDLYLAQCAMSVCKLAIRMALKLSADCISSHKVETADSDGKSGVIRSRSLSQVASPPFELLDQLMRSPTCQLQLIHFFIANESKQYLFFLRLMAKLLTTFPYELLTTTDGETTTTVAAYVSKILLRLFRSAATEAQVIVTVEEDTLFGHLLPAVAAQMTPNRNEPAVTEAIRGAETVVANCVRLVYVVLLDFDYEDDDDGGSLRDTFTRTALLPRLITLLESADAVGESVWRLAIEFLLRLLSRDPRLLRDAETLQLVVPVVRLLRAPSEFAFQSLPSSASRLVKVLVKCDNTRADDLYESGITASLLSGLDFVARGGSSGSSISELLESLLHLLHQRYEQLRQVGQALHFAPGFDDLVNCSPIVIELCATQRMERDEYARPEEVSPNKHIGLGEHDFHEGDQRGEDVADLASRCLVFLSQIFGEKLNEVVFATSNHSQPASDEILARCLAACLGRSDSANGSVVLLRVLLTLKNCLRCQGDNTRVKRWFMGQPSLVGAISSFSSGRRRASLGSGSDEARLPQGAGSVSEQIAKTAATIVRLSNPA